MKHFPDHLFYGGTAARLQAAAEAWRVLRSVTKRNRRPTDKQLEKAFRTLHEVVSPFGGDMSMRRLRAELKRRGLLEALS